MKKGFILSAGLVAALMLASCGSNKESAYKKAYEKAKAQEQAQGSVAQNDAPVVAPLEEKPVTQSTVTDNYDNVVARTEDVTLVNGSGLKAYSVIVGSFSVKANAEGLQNTLKSAGYDAQLAYNSNRNMYRVVAATYDTKGEAARSRDAFRATYPDAWLLFKK
ncbi:SPOR domain-containing protein [Hoylesella enoeca]|uniref:Cell division protein n=1 Tax=Hoylesella enoeca TaxID=76123 RepID=A0A0S2KNZ8_9BACT|nr:SPOR domain-containing protein [Hoylesella enoeca]ALO49796.1 cell division protein [Hoylesella enoeca]